MLTLEEDLSCYHLEYWLALNYKDDEDHSHTLYFCPEFKDFAELIQRLVGGRITEILVLCNKQGTENYVIGNQISLSDEQKITSEQLARITAKLTPDEIYLLKIAYPRG